MTAVTSHLPDRQRFPDFRFLALAAVCCSAVILLSAGRMGAATTWLVSFSIDDVAGADVLSDTKGPYTDYRIPADPHPSPCVETDQSATGGVFAVFNRKIDDIGTRCNPSGSDRQFKIRIDATSACQRIFNAYGSPAVNRPVAPCELSYNDNPRVRVERVFSSQTHGAVAFLTIMEGNPISYEIRADSDATITSMGPNQKRLTYLGTAHLWEFGNGKTRAVADAFSLKQQITFTRYAQ